MRGCVEELLRSGFPIGGAALVVLLRAQAGLGLLPPGTVAVAGLLTNLHVFLEMLPGTLRLANFSVKRAQLVARRPAAGDVRGRAEIQ